MTVFSLHTFCVIFSVHGVGDAFLCVCTDSAPPEEKDEAEGQERAEGKFHHE